MEGNKINLACGNDYREGWLNVDIGENIKVDEKIDLLKFPWPWPDNHFDHLECHQFVEHIPHERPEWGKDGIILFMDEAYRVAKHGAEMVITHPNAFGDLTWCDPTHQRAISLSVWSYFARPWRKQWGFVHYPIFSDWRSINITQEVGEEFKALSDAEAKHRATHYINVIGHTWVTLRAWKKEGDSE